MSDIPNLKGSILIDTRSVDHAVTSVKKLGQSLTEMSGQSGASAQKAARDIGRQVDAYTNLKKSVDAADDATKQSVVTEQRKNLLIAKAASAVANFQKTITQSNLTQQQQIELMNKSSAQLKGYEAAIQSGATSGHNLQAVNTELGVSLAQMKREFSNTSVAIKEKVKEEAEAERQTKRTNAALIASEKATGAATSQYERMAYLVKNSSQQDAEKVSTLSRLQSAHDQLNATIQKHGANSVQTAQAQNRYRQELDKVAMSIGRVNTQARNVAVSKLGSDFRNLTSSVVVALGPLSGVASRLIALQGLFSRNAASLAILLAGMTGLSVLFHKSAKSAQVAEQQLMKLDAQVIQAGESAQMTASEIDRMAHELAAATLLSAEQVRHAAGALLEFGRVGRDQFDQVVLAAQGMTVVFGGSLQQNVRKLGRVLQDPLKNMNLLRETMGEMNKDVKQQVESLMMQGRQYEANNVLLAEFESLAQAAKGEAGGLAGAYDTISGNLDKLFQNLMMGSGALKSITENVNEVTKAIEEFDKSIESQALGLLFKEIADFAGGALKFAIENVKLLAGAFIFVASLALPVVVKSVISLANALTFGLVPSFGKAIAATNLYTTATTRAAVAAGTFGKVVTRFAGPIGLGILVIAQFATAIWATRKAFNAMNSGLASLEAQQSSFVNSTIARGKELIESNRSMSKIQAEFAQRELDKANEKYNSIEKRIEENKTAQEAAQQEIAKGWMKHEQTVTQVLKLEQRKRDVIRNDPGNINQIESLERSITTFKNSNEGLRKSLQGLEVELRAAGVAGVALNRELVRHEEGAKAFVASIAGMEAGGETAEQIFQAQVRSLSALTDEYDKSAAELENLQKALKQAEILQAAFSASSAEGAEHLESVNRVLKVLRDRIESLTFDKAQADAEKFFTNITRGEDQLRDLYAVIDQGSLAEPFIQLNRQVENTVAQLKDLDDETIGKLAKLLDVEGGRDNVTEELRARLMAQGESVIAAEKQIVAQRQINSLMQEQVPLLDQLNAKTTELMMAASSPEQVEAIQRMYKDSLAEIEKMVSEAVISPFGDLSKIKEEKELREAIIRQAYGDNEAMAAEHIANMNEIFERSKTFLVMAHYGEQAVDGLAMAMDTLNNLGRKSGKEYQNLAIAQAAISQGLAIAKMWGDGPGGIESVPIRMAMSALAGAQVGAQIAQIRKQKFASGGLVRGPGTGRSDSIAAMLSNGEFVMSANAVKNIGVNNLERMNRGSAPMMSTGGLIGTTSPGAFSANTNIQIVDQSNGSKDFSVEESTNAFGQKEIRVMISNAMKEGFVRGEFDRELEASFGVRRQGRRL